MPILTRSQKPVAKRTAREFRIAKLYQGMRSGRLLVVLVILVWNEYIWSHTEGLLFVWITKTENRAQWSVDVVGYIFKPVSLCLSLFTNAENMLLLDEVCKLYCTAFASLITVSWNWFSSVRFRLWIEHLSRGAYSSKRVVFLKLCFYFVGKRLKLAKTFLAIAINSKSTKNQNCRCS